MPELGSYTVATPLPTDLVPFTTGGTVKNVQAQSLVKELVVTVGPTGSNSDYVCDGAADDVQVQAAVNAVNTAGGGEIRIRAGAYSFSNAVTLYSHIRMSGENKKTTITLANGVNNGIFVSLASGGYEDIIIEGFTLDGNATNQTGGGTHGALVYITGSDTLLRNITIRDNTVQNAYKHAIFITGDNTSNRYPKWITNNYIFNHGAGTVGFGIYTDYCPNTLIAGNTLKQSNGNDAIEMGHLGDCVCTNNYLVDGKIQFPFANNSVISNNILGTDTIQNDANTANNVVITGNMLLGITPASGYGGISVTGSNPTITNNYILVTAQSGIRVFGSGTGGIISNNFIDGTDPSTGGSNGIYPDHSNDMVITGNNIHNFSVAVQVVFDNNTVSLNKIISCTTGVKLANSSSSGHVISNAQIFYNDLAGATTAFDPQNQTSYSFVTADTNGVQQGHVATNKYGFYGTTPVVQPSTTGTTTGFTAGSGTTVVSGSTFTGNTGSSAYTIGDVVLALKQLGILAA